MGYLHIDNLYKNQSVLQFTEIYALEKVHGTSAWLHYRGICAPVDDGPGTREGCSSPQLLIHSGESQSQFEQLFDRDSLIARLNVLHPGRVVKIHGEAYGGKVQRQAWRYGDKLKFVVFDISVNHQWISVPDAHKLASDLGLEFVDYVRIESKLSLIDAERDRVSTQSVRHGICTVDNPNNAEGVFCRREGVVLKPLVEGVDHSGSRLIAKHKRAEERETKTDRKVDVRKVAAIGEARKIAEEWVTANRLEHVLQHLSLDPVDMTATPVIIREMIADVEREAAGEIIPSTQARAEIGKRTAQLLKTRLAERLKEKANENQE